MFEWVKQNKLKIFSSIVATMILLIFILPMIIEKLFYMKALNEYFVVGYDIKTVLGFYGDVLVLIGTASLGALTLIQNHIAQEKTDEVNRLTLELQRKSMLMAEERYDKNGNKNNQIQLPKFEIENQGYSGFYMNLEANMTNVSELIISNLKSLSFKVLDNGGEIIFTSNDVHLSKKSMKSGDSIKIAFRNDNIAIVNNGMHQPMHDVILEWSFQCEDQYNNTHYFRCSLGVNNTSVFVKEPWKVEKVG